jgi:hypothetical protein
VPKCSAGPVAYPNIFGAGTPPLTAAGTAEAPGTQITADHMTTIANVTARSHDCDKAEARPRLRFLLDNQPGMYDSRDSS